MSDYKRLISYVYMYQNNEKGRNVGFVKLESRNGQCKIGISLRGIPSGNMDMEVFLYSYDKSISVGKIYLRNGQGESRIVTEQENLVNSGFTLDEIGGLKIQNHAAPNIFYATIWDDALMEAPDLHAAQIEEEDTEEEIGEIVIEEKIQEKMEDNEPEIIEENLGLDSEQLGAQSNFEEYMETANKVMESLMSTIFPNDSEKNKENAVQALESRELIPETEELEEQTYKEEKRIEKEPLAEQREENEIPLNQNTEFNMEAAQYIEDVTSEKMNLLGEEVMGMFASRQVQAEEQRDFQKKTPEFNPNSYEEEYHEAVNQHKEPVKFDKEEPKALWKSLERKFPKVRNIATEKPHDILSITPQDIGLLPREAWVYGNNSFLLHGYYQYRYLVLICMNVDSEKERYLIGVPGVYHNNERFMATMFGFPNFYLARKQNSKTGQFGYWCSEIKLT